MQPRVVIETGLSGGHEPSAGKPNRLASLFTEFTLETKQPVSLDLKNQNTLALSLPELLKRAQEKADQILKEDSGKES